MITLIIFLVVLGVLVLAHEFGHFYTAKKSGVAVEEFGVCFPPRLFGVWRDDNGRFQIHWGSKEAQNTGKKTLYSVNLIPLGGFVKIKGESGDAAQDPDSFAHKKAGVRSLILSAGVIMNIVLAAVLLTGALIYGMPAVIDGESSRFATVQNKELKIAQVLKDSPAEKAGLQPNDTVVAVEGLTSAENTAAVTFDTVRATFAARDNKPTTITVARNNKEQSFSVTPRFFEETGKAEIGVGLVETGTISYPWYIAPIKGVQLTGIYTYETVKAFGGLIKNLITGQSVGGDVAGPVGIAVLSGKMARAGVAHLLQFMALLSINLAIINLLPIPGLDGGRLLFIIIEKIRRGKKVTEKTEHLVHGIGFVALIILALVVTVHDVSGLTDGFAHLIGRK